MTGHLIIFAPSELTYEDQGRGEAMVTNRADGSVDVYWYGRLTLSG
jgi:hypothetical protein